MNIEFEKKLGDVLKTSLIDREEPMKKHTTFRVGGNADYFMQPENGEQIRSMISLCREMAIPYYIVGNGSNLLVSDEGYRGVIIQIGSRMSEIKVVGDRITAQAGALLSKIGRAALDAGLTGFEFASGIPGTIGGAVVMNAGAYGGEMKDIIEKVTVLTPEGEVLTLNSGELALGYRTSILPQKGYVALEVQVRLKAGDRAAIKGRMDELKGLRTAKQPLEYPSAGSTFKRPEGYFAGKLIEDAGLRGCSLGGASVSKKHCGFVINTGDATASDIWNLMKKVTEVVKETSGVELEPEVKRLGEF